MLFFYFKESKENIRTVYDLQLQEKTETINSLTVYVEETQSQYNECFSEAAKQDALLDLQRDEIRNLQQKINSTEMDNYLTSISIHIKYYTLLKTIQVEESGRLLYIIV
ncbi:uncharacterized protein LOC143266011 [Megachile rotundata]|uniref:uncharacterized protein LOC143266011 n=1 Tax=Megachile rotundata TaxID=143995 RepID=UPI003FD4A0B4